MKENRAAYDPVNRVILKRLRVSHSARAKTADYSDCMNTMLTSIATQKGVCTVSHGRVIIVKAMPRLTTGERERAVGRLIAGDNARNIANDMHVHISTIYRLENRLGLTGTTADRPRSGRPRQTTARQDRVIVRQHLANPFQTARSTADNTLGRNNRPICDRTVANRLRERGLVCRRPARGPVLTPRHRQARQQWAQQHLNWTWRRWQHVVFTDESRFCLYHADGRVRVWRRARERFHNACVLERNPHGGPGLMIWGGIGINQRMGPVFFVNIGPGRGNGVTAVRYINQVLVPHVQPFFQQHPNAILQQDNARPHSARATQDYLQQQNIPTMQWPSLSPDLNPIEHFWDMLQREINDVQPPPANLADLHQAIIQAWARIPQPAVNRLVHSMRRRCQAVLAARGGHTPY